MPQTCLPERADSATEFTQRFTTRSYNPFLNQLRLLLQNSYQHYADLPTDDSVLEASCLAEVQQRTLSGIEATISLPPMPTVVEKLDKVLSSPDASAAQVSEVVSLDPILVAKTLSLVNSGLFSLRREIDRIDQAVALLGMKQIRNLTLAVTVVGTFSQPSAASFDQHKFWCHSMAVAAACTLIGRVLVDRGDTDVDPEQLFLAGLMHDIGVVIVAQQLRDEHEQICEIVARDNVDQLNVEQAVLGLRHTSMGGRLLQEWNLGAEIVAAAIHHHEPDGHGTVPAIVHCADAIAHGLGFTTYDDRMPQVDPKAWADLKLGNRSTQGVGISLLRQMDSLQQMLRS